MSTTMALHLAISLAMTGLAMAQEKGPFQRGIARWQNREYDRAIADFDEAIRLNPKYAPAYAYRGDSWRQKQEFDKAIADFDEAIRHDPKYVSAYLSRAVVLSQKKEYGKALADYDVGLRLDPRDAGLYNERAWLLATCPDEKCRDGRRAVESATWACELTGWRDGAKLDTLAAAYAEAGDFGKAVEFQEKVNRLLADPVGKEEGEERLRLYKAKKPYRAER